MRDDSDLSDVWRGTLAIMVLKTLEVMGPLHGFPFAVKDLAPVKGIRTTMGSPGLIPAVIRTLPANRAAICTSRGSNTPCARST